MKRHNGRKFRSPKKAEFASGIPDAIEERKRERSDLKRLARRGKPKDAKWLLP